MRGSDLRHANPQRGRIGAASLLSMIVVGGLLVSTPATAGRRCIDVPERIPHRGGRVVTGRLQHFIDGVPDGSCIRFPRRGRYRVEGMLTLVGREHLRILGNGSKLYATSLIGAVDTSGGSSNDPLKDGFRRHLAIVRSADITVRNLRIDGANTSCMFDHDYEFEAGVIVLNSQNVRLIDLRVTQVAGDSVHVHDGSQNVTIDGLRGNCIGRQGVAITEGNGVTVQNSTLTGVARSAFDLEPLDDPITGVRLVNNTVGRFENLFVAAGGLGPISDVYVGGNLLTELGMRSKIGSQNGSPRTNFVFENNASLGGSASSLISLLGVNGFRFVGNTQSMGFQYAITGDSATCNVFAANNVLTGAQGLFAPVLAPPGCWVDGGGNSF